MDTGAHSTKPRLLLVEMDPACARFIAELSTRAVNHALEYHRWLRANISALRAYYAGPHLSVPFGQWAHDRWLAERG